MSCPYFFPVEQLAWPSAPVLPLGDAYAGLCYADPTQAADPGDPALRELCNLGYARGRCARFPESETPDAVRFTIAQDRDGTIRIYWVRERDHHPFDHGPLEYSVAAQAFAAPHADRTVQQQAQAYLASYLRRKMRERETS